MAMLAMHLHSMMNAGYLFQCLRTFIVASPMPVPRRSQSSAWSSMHQGAVSCWVRARFCVARAAAPPRVIEGNRPAVIQRGHKNPCLLAANMIAW
jgi:hypothetical protein